MNEDNEQPGLWTSGGLQRAHQQWHADDENHQTWVQQIATEREAKDNAYHERNQLVAVLSKVWPSHLTIDRQIDGTEWENIVCVHTPAGQATWHIHESELPLFVHLTENDARLREIYCSGWDGHTTEEKYQRLSRIIGSGEYREVAAERDFLVLQVASLERALAEAAKPQPLDVSRATRGEVDDETVANEAWRYWDNVRGLIHERDSARRALASAGITVTHDAAHCLQGKQHSGPCQWEV